MWALWETTVGAVFQVPADAVGASTGTAASNQTGLERALGITRDLEGKQPIAGQDRLAAGAVAMIGGVLGLAPPGG
jgi:hypothetical protein